MPPSASTPNEVFPMEPTTATNILTPATHGESDSPKSIGFDACDSAIHDVDWRNR